MSKGFKRKPIPKSVRMYVFERDSWTCRYCLKERASEIDHVFPVALGGTNDISNLVAACRRCNREKSASIGKPRSFSFQLFGRAVLLFGLSVTIGIDLNLAGFYMWWVFILIGALVFLYLFMRSLRVALRSRREIKL